MKTIKIIDIVKLIEKKNYKNLPKKIKINNKTYKFDKTDNEYRRYDRGGSFTPLFEFMKNGVIEYFSELIQMEAEIIEEELKIEPFTEEELEVYHDMSAPIDDLAHKVGLLIDAVNELRKEK